MSVWKTAIAGSLAGTMIAGQVEQASAAPMPTNVAAMKAVAGNDTTQVYWRGGWGWGLGGLAAAAIIGGAIAASSAPYGYYGGPYYGGYGYPGPYYGGGYSYGYGPAYYGYAPAYGYPGYYGGYRSYYSYGPYRPYYYGYHRRFYHRAYW